MVMKRYLPVLLALFSFSCSAPAGVTNDNPGSRRITQRVWELRKIYLDSVNLAAPVYILLSGSGQISGFAGCNTFAGRYVMHDVKFELTEAAAVTRKYCDSTNVETRFMSYLQQAERIKVFDDRLELQKEGVTILSFEEKKER